VQTFANGRFAPGFLLPSITSAIVSFQIFAAALVSAGKAWEQIDSVMFWSADRYALAQQARRVRVPERMQAHPFQPNFTRHLHHAGNEPIW
jgi:hypothetical protein